MKKKNFDNKLNQAKERVSELQDCHLMISNDQKEKRKGSKKKKEF